MSSILKVDTLQDTGANTLISSDGSGNVTSNVLTPSFLASNNSGASLPAITHTKLNFNNEILDTDSAYDATNSKFTVPTGKAGKYLIGFNWRTDGLSGQTRIIGSIKINDAFYLYVETFDGASTFTAGSACVSSVFDLAVGDYVECFGYCNVAATQQPDFADTDQRFWGMRIGD